MVIVPRKFRPVRVDTAGSPSPWMIGSSLSILMTASVAQEWTENHDAEWAALAGLDRVARGVGFRFVVTGDETHVDQIPPDDPAHAYAGTPDPDAICNRCGSLGYLIDERCSLNRCPGTMVALVTDLVAALAKALDDLDETTYGEVPDVVAAVRDAAQALIVDLREKAGA